MSRLCLLIIINRRPESEGPESLEDEESQFVNEFKHEVEVPHSIPPWLWGVCKYGLILSLTYVGCRASGITHIQ